MARMIRKQFYITQQQDALLKRLAKARGVSESAIVRQAIDQLADVPSTSEFHPDPEAWERALQFMLGLRDLGPLDQPATKWTRDELYEDRLSRYKRDAD
jgi:Ribbon-helix-helix protein, copG family